MYRVKSPTHLIDFWSLKSILKSLEIILISMKSNDFEITYAIFASVGPLGVRVQAHTYATSYLLWVISTNDKNTSLSSSILRVSLLVYVYTHHTKGALRAPLVSMIHTLSSPNRMPFYLAY